MPPPYGAGPGVPPPPKAPAPPYEQGSPYAAPQPPDGGQQPPYGGRQPPYGAQPPPYGGQPPGYGPNPYPQGGSPYGAPGPYGYPMPPQGWYVERTTNGLAIASLVTALSCIPLLGTILGIAALRQIKRRGQGGRGLAIAGVTVGSIATLATAAVFVAAALGAMDEGNTKVDDIRAGQCFNTVGTPLRDYGTDRSSRATTVNVVSCAKEHDAEAFAVYTLDPDGDGSYPGTDEVARQASAHCAAEGLRYLNGVPLPDGMRLFYYMPSHDVWDRGDREATCFFGSPGDKVTGSVKHSFDAPGGSSGGSDGGSDAGSDGGSDDSGGIGV